MTARLGQQFPRAFVTGASVGLGAAFARMLLDEGVQVWGTSRQINRLPAREGFHPVTLELSDGAAAERTFLELDREVGGFDLVINNAGFGVFGSFAETDFAVWQRQMDLMLVNTARLAHAALRVMRPRGRGTLVNISSLAAEFPLPFQSAYNVVKAGLSALSESLMFETEGTGLVVIDFRPGDYRTDFESTMRRPAEFADARQERVWRAFSRLMQQGPMPEHAAAKLCRTLRRNRSGTVRTGRLFQALFAPFLTRFGSLALRRRVIRSYFDL